MPLKIQPYTLSNQKSRPPAHDKEEEISFEQPPTAMELFNALLQENWNDSKLRSFVLEMTAYIDLLENRKSLALDKYPQLTTNESVVFPVTYIRSNEMLSRINK